MSKLKRLAIIAVMIKIFVTIMVLTSVQVSDGHVKKGNVKSVYDGYGSGTAKSFI